MILGRNMFLWFMLVGSVLGTSTDEFREFTNNGVEDFMQKNEKSNIVPSMFGSSDIHTQINAADKTEWSNLLMLDPSNNYLKVFNKHIEEGKTAKDLTFCIYDDNMREAAIALFRIFQTSEHETFVKVKEWAKNNINKEMYMYALRLESVYSGKTNESSLLPPFIWNPHYFVNSESLIKASIISNDIKSNAAVTNSQISKMNPDNYVDGIMNEFAIVNANYSRWNLPKKSKENVLNYFREDVSLNSYYLGIHLLHPFWMSNEELEFNNPRFAERYYYAHQQLMARYYLEQLHVKTGNPSLSINYSEYEPYLSYKNGLPFPARSCLAGDWDKEKAYLKNVDIAIRECISRGLIIMQNGTTLTMTDDSHINILAKLIRANVDGVKFAKIARSMMGYGSNEYPIDEYNPAPTVLHHPETSLRDPIYWFMLQHMLNYFTDYKNTMEPFDLSQFESNEYVIIDFEFSKLMTYFDYYKFSVNYATSNDIKDATDWLNYVTVRQRRLEHIDFYLNFTVETAFKKDVIVRLYLGPECNSNECWDQYNYFFEIDTFRTTVEEGRNQISWCPKCNDRFSFDYDYNKFVLKTGSTKHSIFKFPERLMIPRGLEEGLNLTLFIMITPADDEDEMMLYPPNFYRQVSTQLDSKPLGFPFHRQAKGFSESAANYKFFNVSIYHKYQSVDYDKGYFSPYLY